MVICIPGAEIVDSPIFFYLNTIVLQLVFPPRYLNALCLLK